eukprot:11951146-Alexandrium_andersonii.AAC.1
MAVRVSVMIELCNCCKSVLVTICCKSVFVAIEAAIASRRARSGSVDPAAELVPPEAKGKGGRPAE